MTIKFIRSNFLYATVFLTGASVLIVEIVATRILSPYFGNTIFTVSSVISTILAALSFGYYIGGKLADRFPTLKHFFGIISLSGVTLLLTHLLGAMILPTLGFGLSVSVGPLVSSILLFLIPAVLLGMLSPYAVKLQTLRTPKEGIGSVAGKMFFWSTFGSIVGSLSAGFILIPLFGINQIMLTNAMFIFCLGFIPLVLIGANRKFLTYFAVAFIALFSYTWVSAQAANANEGMVYVKDGLYEKISIYDSEHSGRPARFFQQDKSSSGAMFLDTDDPTDLVYEYTKYYRLHKLFTPKVNDALVIGGGAYSIPRALLHELPDSQVDVSEIEPSLFDLAKKYFRVQDTPRLKNFTEDGRRMLKDTEKKYDLIFSDVYYSYFSVPSHFTTQEFFEVAKDRLNDKGLFVASMVGDLSRQQPSLTMSEIKTFQKVFPNSYFFATRSPGMTGSQNIIFVGYNSDKILDISSLDLRDETNPTIRELPDKIIDISRFELSPYALLKDDYAPVDYLTAQVLRRREDKRLLNSQEMLALIEQQLRYGPRHLSAPGHKSMQRFLQAELKAIGIDATVQSWRHRDKKGQEHELANIIARVHPERTRRIILGTHYDTKKQAHNDDPNTPVPGANDGASGVAVLLELLRARSVLDLPNDVGIDVIFFDGEEGEEHIGSDYSDWAPLGSEYFAGNLDKLYGKSKPESGVVLDMVCDKDLALLKEPSSPREQTDKFWNVGSDTYPNIFRDEFQHTIRDDHTAMNEAGIPTLLVIDFDYSHFHTSRDTADKCSSDSLDAVANTLASYLGTL